VAPDKTMPNEDVIREIATRACREALHEKSQELAVDIARRMGVVLAKQPAPREQTKELRDGAVLIAGSRNQTETLEALLAASSAITPKCGLLILRGAQASGWSCHGLTSLENFKRATLECTRGVAATVITSCTAKAARVSELDPGFTSKLGLESSAQVLLVPVLLKERVAALLIALSQEIDDLARLELLVQVSQLTLDLHAYRKAAPQHAAEPPPHAESHRAAAPPPTQKNPDDTPNEPPKAAPPHTAPVNAASATTRAGFAVASSVTPVLDEAHEKARRFAKLLVEEIKLYNQTKVSEGRARGDLYSRLREDIEKSRAAYHKRYGESVKDVDYFTQELMRILADNDRTVMGTGFPG
jgi:hypothetical protein